MLLHLVLLLPFASALILALGSGRDNEATTRTGVVLALVNAIAGLGLLLEGGGAATDSVRWFTLPGTGAVVTWQLASDGLSAWLVQLITWLTPVALIAGQASAGERMREYGSLIFVLAGAMIGALLVTDLVCFYIFYEAMLVPMLMIIAAFGDEHRRGAALQFILYTMLSSVGMLVAIWYIGARVGSTEIAVLADTLPQMLSASEAGWLFLAFVVAFGVKVPLLPLHSWQAPAYASAPAGAGVLLGGVMAKIGIYGFLRIVLPFFPVEVEAWQVLFIALGGIGAVVGALLALAQTDLKRILAYSSLGHLGLVVAAIFTLHETALTGAGVQLVAHGLAVGALFLVVAHLEATTGKRGIDQFSGLAQGSPVLATIMVTATMVSVALPGTLSFVGEFQMLYGLYLSNTIGVFWVCLIATSVILGAVYALRVVQRVFYGAEGVRADAVARPANGLQLVGGAVLAAAVVLGFYPAPITSAMNTAVRDMAVVAAPMTADADASEINKPIATNEPHIAVEVP